MKTDYDQVMSVLADHTPEEIVRLTANPMELEAQLSLTSSEPISLEPDTPAAWEAAVADGMKYDRADKTIYRLIEENPSAWEAFKATVSKLAPESDITAHLESYDPSDLLYSGGVV